MNRNLSDLFIGKVKFPGGNTAKSNAPASVPGSQFKAGAVAGRQQFAILFRDPVIDDWSYGMEDVFAGKIECGGDFRFPGRFIVSLAFHDIVAKQSKLNTAAGMHHIIDAGVKRIKTAEQSAVRGVHDRVGPQGGNCLLYTSANRFAWMPSYCLPSMMRRYLRNRYTKILKNMYLT